MREFLLSIIILIVIYEKTPETREIVVYEYGTELDYMIKVYGPEESGYPEPEVEKEVKPLSYADLVKLWVPDYY